MDLTDEEILNGTVEEITFQNNVNGFTVLDVSSGGELITAVGVMPGVAAGESVTLKGSYIIHATFGRQLKVTSFSRTMPETTEQIYKYLSSGVIRGIGPKKALAIIDAFGSDTLDIIENDSEKLSRIKGISVEQARSLGDEFKKQYAMRAVILGLEKYGLTPNECVRIYNKLGIQAVEAVKKNPYCLCGLSIGISFEKAEQIETQLDEKIVPDFRINEGILHIMRYNRNSHGHTCIPREKLLSPASDLLGVKTDTIDIAIDRLIATAYIKSAVLNKTEFLFLPSSYNDEIKIAERIKLMVKFPPPRSETLSDMIDDIEKKNGISYEALQRTAIATAANKGLLILTGGPGTGKTTAIKGIIDIFERQHLDIALAAPTGRAAKRMCEVTGFEAKTIHRLLEVEWDEDDKPVFRKNLTNPLECNALILDELSMVDTSLFASLIDALPLGCRLVLVGDSDQLPPVGPGNVLRDIILSGELPVVQLTEVFRQALESKIIYNAHRIVGGEAPDLEKDSKSDFFHMERPTPASAAETIRSLICERLPAAYGWDSFSDIQVICPSKKGDSGTHALNRLLQNSLNPKDENKSEISINGQLFRTGDKIMQIKNNYNIEWKTADDKGTGIFNGDIGYLEKIDIKSGVISVDFDGRKTEIPAEYLSELELAYAITVHKSQGSEFKAVVIPVIGVVDNLAYRNLLYTAVTRARDMLITVGSADMIRRMANNDRKSKRYSALSYFLKDE